MWVVRFRGVSRSSALFHLKPTMYISVGPPRRSAGPRPLYAGGATCAWSVVLGAVRQCVTLSHCSEAAGQQAHVVRKLLTHHATQKSTAAPADSLRPLPPSVCLAGLYSGRHATRSSSRSQFRCLADCCAMDGVTRKRPKRSFMLQCAHAENMKGKHLVYGRLLELGFGVQGV